MIVFAGIMPHPPLVIPQIGKEDSKKVAATYDAMEKLAKELAAAEPDTIIIISPHMIHYPNFFNVCGMERLYGTFQHFGWKDFEWHGNNNLELAEELADKLEDEELPSILYNNQEASYELDHGVTVPLYFINNQIEYPYKLLPVSYSLSSRAENYTFGEIIASVCKKRAGERIAMIASGDLSHRLLENHSGQFTPKEFDQQFIDLIKKGDDYSVINMDEDLVENAGECGYRSVLVLLGAVSGLEVLPEVYSYEGPFGVGYMVANMNVTN